MGKICKWLSANYSYRKFKERDLLDFTNPNKLGKYAELQALKFLQSNGMRLIQKNFRSKFGEIDLIMQDKSTKVFVEVRYRSNSKFGNGSLSVDKKKQKKIINTARFYIMQNGLQNYRFDIISMKNSDDEKADIIVEKWIKNAF